MKTSLTMLLAAACLTACAGATPKVMNLPTASAVELSTLLSSDPRLARVVDEAARFRLQVVLGTVVPGPGGKPRLAQQGFRLGEEYFYPASSIKLFAAIAGLEKRAELARATQLPLTADTPLVYHPLFDGEERVELDPTNLAGGKITLRHEVRKLALVSNNEAFNRLYELVGQDGLAASLERAGLGEARIVHRLEEARSAEENRRFPRIDFAGEGFTYTLIERQSEVLPPAPKMPGLLVGSAYLAGGAKVEEPMDFSAKNRMGLADLQRGLCKVVAPDVDCGGLPFALDAADRAWLLEAMERFPRQSTNPVYPGSEYPDDYVKFFLPGLVRVLPADRLSIVNKIGQAYGFTTDNAWIVDQTTGRGFFLAATLYTNDDGVLNDDRYEYTTVARPFLADLAEVVARQLWQTRTP